MSRTGWAVAVISKLPRPGRTKTRLARTLGEPAALALHRAFLEDELDQLDRPRSWSLHLVHDAPEGPEERMALEALLGDRATSLVPGGEGLAEELLAAFQLLLADHERAVIVSGAVPQLGAAPVQAARGARDRADVVLGAGPDGGYYLVGLRQPHDLFTSVPMSTGAVANATLALAARRGLSTAEVDSLTDIDEAQDLLALAGCEPGRARATRAVVDGLERGEVAPALPSELQLEVSSRCNLRCKGCRITFDDLGPQRDLTLEEYRRVVGGLPDLRRIAFQLNGESLLNPAVFDMIREASAAGLETVLNTNGTLLDPARRAALLASGLDELRVSLDGATASTVSTMADAEVFDKVVAGVRALVAERGRARRPRIGLWMVGNRDNIGELPALVMLAADLGADEVYLQRLVLFGQGTATAERSLHGRVDARVRALIAEAESVATRTGVALRASGRVPLLESLEPTGGDRPQLGCWRPWRTATVTASGRVLPCCISSFLEPYDALERGDLDQQSWAEIWNGPRYRALRRGILSGEPLSCCARCGLDWSL